MPDPPEERLLSQRFRQQHQQRPMIQSHHDELRILIRPADRRASVLHPHPGDAPSQPHLSPTGLDVLPRRLRQQRRQPNPGPAHVGAVPVAQEPFLKHHQRQVSADRSDVSVQRRQHDQVPEAADGVLRLTVGAEPIGEGDAVQAPACRPVQGAYPRHSVGRAHLLRRRERAEPQQRREEMQRRRQRPALQHALSPHLVNYPHPHPLLKVRLLPYTQPLQEPDVFRAATHEHVLAVVHFHPGPLIDVGVGASAQKGPFLHQRHVQPGVGQFAGGGDTGQAGAGHENGRPLAHSTRLLTSSRPASASFWPALRLSRRLSTVSGARSISSRIVLYIPAMTPTHALARRGR